MIARLLDMTDRVAMGLSSRARNLYFRARGVHINGYCWLRAIEIPRLHAMIELDTCSLDRGVILLCSDDPTDSLKSSAKISIGPGTYINRGTFIDAVGSVRIGSQAAIGPGCYITDHDHGNDLSRGPLDQPMIVRPTVIGDGVWIGAHAIILKGVTIGDRTIVAAGSVVTKSLPPEVIAAGVPARVLRQRPSEAVAIGASS